MNSRLLRVMIVCTCTFLSASAFADGTPLFRSLRADQEAATFTPNERKRIEELRKLPGSRRSSVISFDRNSVLSNIIVVSTLDGEQVTFTKVRSGMEEVPNLTTGEKHQSFVWIGKSPKGGEIVIATSSTGISGVINVPGQRGLFIRGINDSYQLLVEDDPTKHIVGGDDVGGSTK